MKKHSLSFAFVCIVLTSVTAQTLKKTFYDWNKTQPKEVYYVNANGEKNGNYKAYFENGVISNDANFKNGTLDGAYKEYTGYGGKACLIKAVTYKNGDATGPAIFYSSQKCNIKAASGNLENGKRVGNWTFVEEGSQNLSEGFQYISYTQKIDGEVVVEDAKTIYYYPSMKILSEFKGNQRLTYSPTGKIIGTETFDANGILIEGKIFYMNGAKAETTNNYIESGKKIYEENSWYENGNVKTKKKSVDESSEESSWYENGKLKTQSKTVAGKIISYEGYNEDGSKSRYMIDLEERKTLNEKSDKEHAQKLANQKSDYIKAISIADSLLEKRIYNKASTAYEEISKDASYDLRMLLGDSTNAPFLLEKKKYADVKIDEIYKTAAEINKVKQQFKDIDDRYEKFVKLYGGVKEMKKVFDVEVASTSYPKGEYLYTKADAHFKELQSSYKSETDTKIGLEKGKRLIEILDNLIKLAETDTKDLNKALKKTKTKEEEVQLLGF